VIPSLGPAQTQLSFGRVSLSGFSEAAADRKGWGPGKFGGREGGREVSFPGPQLQIAP
jgi:hypothetical protein